MSKKVMFTIEGKEFRLNDYVMKPITASGYWSTTSDRWDINMSDIFTYLIHRVGRYTENYASDLIYYIEAIKDSLTEYDINGKTFLIGIRYNGVDGNSYIASRIRNKEDLSREYIDGVYMLQFFQDEKSAEAIFGKTSFYSYS